MELKTNKLFPRGASQSPLEVYEIGYTPSKGVM